MLEYFHSGRGVDNYRQIWFCRLRSLGEFGVSCSVEAQVVLRLLSDSSPASTRRLGIGLDLKAPVHIRIAEW